MSVSKKTKPADKSRFDTWIKIIPICLTAAALLFGAYQWYIANKKTQSEKGTWAVKKQSYEELIALVGKIRAVKNNDSVIKALSLEFDAFYYAKMKQAEVNDSALTFSMMMMKKDIQNTIDHKNDYYQADKLGKTCQKLTEQINNAINKGDREN